MTTTHTEYEEVFAGEYVKFPDPGTQVEGEVSDYHRTEGATDFNGETCGRLVLVTDGNDICTIALDKPALRDAVHNARPEPGDRMRVRFDEWKMGKNGREYKVFRVWVARKHPEPF